MNCIELFLVSSEQLSQTASLYSKRGLTKAIYIFSKDVLLTLNLRALRRLRRVQAFSDIFFTCIFQSHESENVRPRCLWVGVS